MPVQMEVCKQKVEIYFIFPAAFPFIPDEQKTPSLPPPPPAQTNSECGAETVFL